MGEGKKPTIQGNKRVQLRIDLYDKNQRWLERLPPLGQLWFYTNPEVSITRFDFQRLNFLQVHEGM